MPLRICALILVIGLAGSHRRVTATEPPAPEDIVVHHDVPYREGPSRQWKLDLAMKKDARGNVSDVKAKSKVFKVECETTAPTPTPTPTPTPVRPTPTPTATPGGEEEGANPTPTATPGGNVSGATSKPHHTLPPTDTVLTPTADAGHSDAWRMAVMALAGMLATVLLLTPVRSPVRRR